MGDRYQQEADILTRDRGYGFVVAAFVIAVVACGAVAFAPLTTVTTTSVSGDVGDEESATQPPVVRERQSTVEAQGWAEVAPLTVPSSWSPVSRCWPRRVAAPEPCGRSVPRCCSSASP